MNKCRVCNVSTDKSQGQWWSLSNYFGLSGRFCPDCYDKVSHDSYANPNYPGEYMKILLMLAGEKNAS